MSKKRFAILVAVIALVFPFSGCLALDREMNQAHLDKMKWHVYKFAGEDNRDPDYDPLRETNKRLDRMYSEFSWLFLDYDQYQPAGTDQ